MKAFPVTESAYIHDEEGMDLRDYFAAKAMQGIVMCSYNPNFGFPENEALVQRGISITAYQIADEMMEARNDR